MADSVTYTRQGDVHTFETGLPGFEKIVIDHTGLPEEQRAGVAKCLLACAALSCYASALAGSLEAREAHYSSISAKARMDLGANEAGQGRVRHIHLDVSVDLPQQDSEIFERCAKIMKKGCLVTGSMHEGIDMTYELTPNYTK